MTLGMCTCAAGSTGAICKHQVAVAEITMAALPQLFVASIEKRRLLAEVALGRGNVPDNFFQDLMNLQESKVFTDNASDPLCTNSTASEPSVSNPSNTSMYIPSDNDSDDFQPAPKSAKFVIPDSIVVNLTSTLKTSLCEYGNESTVEAINKFVDRLKKVRNPSSLNSFLFSAGSSLGAKRLSRGKIPVQPTSTERRRAGMPRGASTVGRGRPPALAPTKKLKRKHNIALNIAENVPGAK